MPKFLNTMGTADNTFIVKHQGTEVGVYARTEAQAKQRAVEHFKPKKAVKNDFKVRMVQQNHVPEIIDNTSEDDYHGDDE